MEIKAEDLNRVIQIAFESTCPIFKHISGNEFEFLGSSVLFKFDDIHYIFSASHVFDKTKVKRYVIGVSNSMIGIYKGKYHISNLLESKRLFENKIETDISIVELDDEAVEMILKDGGKQFLELKDLAINQKVDDDSYLVLGFPQDRTKNDTKDNTIWRLNLLSFVNTESSKKLYKKHGINPLTHLVIDYDKKMYKVENQDKDKVKLPRLEGISGGGVWSLHLSNDIIVPKLSGILSDYRLKDRPIIISNRIENYSELLRFLGVKKMPKYIHSIKIRNENE